MRYRIVCRDNENSYLPLFYSIGCIDGDREYLLQEITNNDKFCRDQQNISYDYFLESIKKDTCLYITEKGKVFGCCSIIINRGGIVIYGICVPESSKKGSGTLLIDKIKELANSLGIAISLSASSKVKKFYEKNGFTEVGKSLIDDDDDDDDILMVFRRGGKSRNRKSLKSIKQKDKRKTIKNQKYNL